MQKLAGFRKLWLAAPVALVATGAFLRLYRLGAAGFWWDEVLVVLVARKPLPYMMAWLYKAQNLHPPALYFITRFILHFTNSEAALRLPSALASIVALALLYRMAARHVSRTAAVISLAFTAFSMHEIYVARQLRPYGFVILAAVISLDYFLNALKHNRLRDWTIAALAVTAGLYFHYSILLLGAAEAAAFAATLLVRYPPRWGFARGPATATAGLGLVVLAGRWLSVPTMSPWEKAGAFVLAAYLAGELVSLLVRSARAGGSGPSMAAKAAAACGVAAVAYLPWISYFAHLVDAGAPRNMNRPNPITLERVVGVVRDTIAPGDVTYLGVLDRNFYAGIVLAIAGLGILALLAKKREAGITALSALAVPFVMIFAMGWSAWFNVTHFIYCFPVLAVAVGAGVEEAARLATERKRGAEVLAAVVAAVLAIGGGRTFACAVPVFGRWLEGYSGWPAGGGWWTAAGWIAWAFGAAALLVLARGAPVKAAAASIWALALAYPSALMVRWELSPENIGWGYVMPSAKLGAAEWAGLKPGRFGWGYREAAAYLERRLASGERFGVLTQDMGYLETLRFYGGPRLREVLRAEGPPPADAEVLRFALVGQMNYDPACRLGAGSRVVGSETFGGAMVTMVEIKRRAPIATGEGPAGRWTRDGDAYVWHLDFKTLDVFAEAEDFERTTYDLGLGWFIPSVNDEPGWVTFTFEAPEGLAIASCKVTADIHILAGENRAALEVRSGPGAESADEGPALAESETDRTGALTADVEIPRARSRTVSVRVELMAGSGAPNYPVGNMTFVSLRDMKVRFTCAPEAVTRKPAQ